MYKKFLTVICSTILVTGCVGFKANNLPEVTSSEFDLSSNTKTKIFSRWVVISENEYAIESNKEWFAIEHKEHFEEAIASSNCCVVVEDATEANVIVDGTAYLQDAGLTIIPAFLTGISLHVIPSWYTNEVHISVEAKVGDNTTSYDLKDTSKSVHWLPLIFAMPFTGSDSSVGESVEVNTHKNLILQMKSDGVLN